MTPIGRHIQHVLDSNRGLWKSIARRELLAGLGRFRLWYLLHLARPSHLRLLYRQVHAHPPRSLMEFGVEVRRTLTLLQIICQMSGGKFPRYIALDEFESSSVRDPVSLKGLYRTLRRLGVEPRLLPGRPEAVLPVWANHIRDVEVLVIWKENQLPTDNRLWLFIPRMLAPDGQIWCETTSSGRHRWQVISKAEAERRAENAIRRRAA